MKKLGQIETLIILILFQPFLIISLELHSPDMKDEGEDLGGGVLIRRPTLDCSKYTHVATHHPYERPSLSGRHGWNRIYTNGKGISRSFSWVSLLDSRKANIFYFNCSAKYPLEFGISPELEDCNMSHTLRKNLEYRVKTPEEEGNSTLETTTFYSYSYSTYTEIGPPYVVGLYCQGVCNSLKTEAFYEFDSAPRNDSNSDSDKGPSASIRHSPTFNLFGLQDVCLEQDRLNLEYMEDTYWWRKFKEIWKDYPNILRGLGIVSIPIIGMLTTILISYWWYRADCPCRKRQPNRVRAQSTDWYQLSDFRV